MNFETPSRDFGDFQTPPDLVQQILQILGPVGRIWPRVLEPTCGTGNFIAGLLSLAHPPREIRAFELQEAHVREAERVARVSSKVVTKIACANIFDVNFGRDLLWSESGPLLVLGNPPWVTSAELGSLHSCNIPKKSNFKKLRGIDAMTGKSNFDLAEHILIKVATELVDELPSIAMLCKASVARNVLRFAGDHSLPVAETCMRRIDAKKWFGASVDACLFIMKIGGHARATEARVYPGLFSKEPEATVRFDRVHISVDFPRTSGTASGMKILLDWRQGIKHDAASVMELASVCGILTNRLDEEVNVETDHVYPLLKGSDLFRQDDPTPRRSLIVTQKSLKEETAGLEYTAPKLWEYLNKNREVFRARKSRVFNRGMDFSMFGVGKYAFAHYKVAVAGFYRTARFRVIRPIEGRPVMLDDTCYFVGCQSLEHAGLLASMLNHPICTTWMDSVIFPDSKRPITKSLLSRIDVQALFNLIDCNELSALYAAAMERWRGPMAQSLHTHEEDPPDVRLRRMLLTLQDPTSP
jgi:hypothetical protein